MALRIAINGYGRIGRNILRSLFESRRTHEFEIIAINSIGSFESAKHLTRYDTTHGRFMGEVDLDGTNLIVNGHAIKLIQERDPAKLPWKELKIDIVFECSGLFTKRDKAAAHLTAGAKKVLLSAPGDDVDATIVYGVNHHILKPEHQIVSNASCTTNCLAPLAKVLHESIGIDSGIMTTTHAYTNDQVLVDGDHIDLHRARAAAHNIIPTKTGAAKAVGLVLPELKGKLDGSSLRVPVLNVSLVDLTFLPSRPTTVDEINAVIKKASEGPMKGILAYNNEPLVSTDFNHHPASSIYDASQTRLVNKLVKVMAWYDNEWGFSNRMWDVAKTMPW